MDEAASRLRNGCDWTTSTSTVGRRFSICSFLSGPSPPSFVRTAPIKPQLRVVQPPRHSSAALAGSALFVMGATLVSTVLGFAREVVNARYYGTHWEMDAFLA